jgi:RNA polymerase sigma factor (sigma-70 family)
MTKEAGVVRGKTKQGLMSAYEAYTRKEPGSLDLLLDLVRKFAYTKAYHLEYDFKKFGSAETADDWAQDITIKVWQGLEKFEGSSELFYSWVHKIAFNKATDAFNSLSEGKRSKVGLSVKVEDDEGLHEIDNPEIYASTVDYSRGVLIPASVTGVDRRICYMMITPVKEENKKTGEWYERGRTHKEVAFAMGMTEDAVESRIRRMSKRLEEERQTARAAAAARSIGSK